ncbi:MAG: hypothetical protein K5876_01450 [Ruminiclostridium sp.]|nr:hypothetical protein [Ruminiclostridium sp.]
MTVQVMSGTAAVPSVSPEKTPADKPYVYTPPEPVYSVTDRTYTRSRRSLGFAAVIAAQIAASVLLGAALWAGLSFGGEGVGEICAGLKELFG